MGGKNQDSQQWRPKLVRIRRGREAIDEEAPGLLDPHEILGN